MGISRKDPRCYFLRLRQGSPFCKQFSSKSSDDYHLGMAFDEAHYIRATPILIKKGIQGHLSSTNIRNKLHYH